MFQDDTRTIGLPDAVQDEALVGVGYSIETIETPCIYVPGPCSVCTIQPPAYLYCLPMFKDLPDAVEDEALVGVGDVDILVLLGVGLHPGRTTN